MSASLVGSEMCIRDRAHAALSARFQRFKHALGSFLPSLSGGDYGPPDPCLLYTSDAADDM
eukprot:13646461-Alexandrium_andersonii.AAC.1